MSRKSISTGIGIAALLCSSVFILAAKLTEGTAALAATAGDAPPIRRLFGAACSDKPWPYFESNCVRDRRQPAGKAREVRIVTTDRLPGKPPAQLALRFVFDSSIER
jgi:hypothetical protein